MKKHIISTDRKARASAFPTSCGSTGFTRIVTETGETANVIIETRNWLFKVCSMVKYIRYFFYIVVLAIIIPFIGVYIYDAYVSESCKLKQNFLKIKPFMEQLKYMEGEEYFEIIDNHYKFKIGPEWEYGYFECIIPDLAGVQASKIQVDGKYIISIWRYHL